MTELLESGWTIATIAARLGVSRVTVSRWHAGTQAPHALAADALARLATEVAPEARGRGRPRRKAAQ